MKFIFLIFIISLYSLNLLSQTSSIIPNHGQWQEEVKFMAQSGNQTIWGTDKGLVYKIFKDSQDSVGTYVTCNYVGANSFDISYRETDTYYNYMLGNDPAKWRKKVPLCTAAEANNVFENVDIKYFFQNNNLRYDFYLHKNAKPETIKLRFSGHEKLYVDKKGELVIQTKSGDIKHGNLKSYKSDEILASNHIKSSFEVLDNSTVSFQVAETEDPNMIIDPVVFGTYYGTWVGDFSWDTKIMDDGRVFVVGETGHNSLPLTEGAIDTTYGDKLQFSQGFISVFDINSKKLLYATLWGTRDGNDVKLIDVDKEGNVYVICKDDPATFYKTDDAFIKESEHTTYLMQGCLTVFNPEISEVIYSSPLGSHNELTTIIDMEVVDGIIYFIGAHRRETEDYIIHASQNAYKTEYIEGDMANAIVGAFDYKTSSFKYLTYLGTNTVYNLSMAVTEEKDICVLGIYQDYGIQGTEGSFSNIQSEEGTFVAKFDSSLQHAKYISILHDRGYWNGNTFNIEAYPNGDLVIVTSSLPPIFEKDAYTYYFKDKTGWCPEGLGLSIMRLSNDGSQIVSSAFIEMDIYLGTEDIVVDLDKDENIYVYSQVTNDSMPVTKGYFCNEIIGNNHRETGYFQVFNPNLDSLLYATYLCADWDVFVKDIDIDSAGNVALLSLVGPGDLLPVTEGEFQQHFGDLDVYLLVIKPDIGTGVEEDVIFDSFPKAYPNPIANGTLSIDLDQAEEITNVQMFNYMGELVASFPELENTYTKNLQLQIGNYPAGAYVIRISCKEKVISKNIIVE